MSAHTSAGTTLYACADTPATFDAAGYAALSWTKVNGITNYGEQGRQYALVTTTPVDNRGTRKYKGSFNEGTMDLSIDIDEADTGQGILRTASVSDADISFRLTLPSGSVRYFQAKVMSFRENVAGVDNMTTVSVPLELTTADDGTGIVRVAA